MTSLRLLQMKENAGYTLVEFLGVTAILIVLSLIGIQVYDDATDRVRLAKSHEELRRIEVALESYRADHAHYPAKLSDLIEKGYMKIDTTFESPWTTSRRRLYYFYAVDSAQREKARSFALGDPGPTCKRSSGGDAVVLHADSFESLPCGRHPNNTAWSFYIDKDIMLEGGSVSMVRGHASLREFRTSCRKNRRGIQTGHRRCDLKTES